MQNGDYFNGNGLTDDQPYRLKWASSPSWVDYVPQMNDLDSTQKARVGDDCQLILFRQFNDSLNLLKGQRIVQVYLGVPTFNRAVYLSDEGVNIEYLGAFYFSENRRIDTIEFLAIDESKIHSLAEKVKLPTNGYLISS